MTDGNRRRNAKESSGRSTPSDTGDGRAFWDGVLPGTVERGGRRPLPHLGTVAFLGYYYPVGVQSCIYPYMSVQWGDMNSVRLGRAGWCGVY